MREKHKSFVLRNIHLASVALPNINLYINYREGFIGTTLKKEEFLFECSDLDEVIIFRKNGVMMITRVSEKAFVGKDILYVGLWKKKDERTIYNMIYRHGKKGPVFMKRFTATGLIRDNQYQLIQAEEGSKVLYFSANTNGESEVDIYLKGGSRVKKQSFTIDFAQLLIKGKNAKGNLLTKYPVRKISLKSYGTSTLSAREIWFNEENYSLNSEGVGKLLGNFQGEDQLLVLSPRGIAELIRIDLGRSFTEKPLFLEKWQPGKVFSCIYFDGEKNNYFLKRFLIDEKANPKAFFIENHRESFIQWISSCSEAHIELIFTSSNTEDKNSQRIRLTEFTPVKNIKTKGKVLSKMTIRSIKINELFKEKEENFSSKKSERD